MRFVYDDGGRAASGFRGPTGDCVARSIAIVTGRSYVEVYDRLAEGNATQRRTRRSGRASGVRTAARGISTRRKWFADLMAEWGFVWTPTMSIGAGTTVHLRDGELPAGRLVVACSKHYTAVVDGVIHDTYDPARGGTRCVYGYWKLNPARGA